MIYIDRIDAGAIPTTVEIAFPLNKDITIVYTDIIDGGGADIAEDADNVTVIDGGDASSVQTKTVDGGDSVNSGSVSFESSHTLVFRHVATNTSYNLKCRAVEKSKLFITVELFIEEKMYRGQYVMTLTDNTTGEVLYTDLLQVGDVLYKYKNQVNLTQYER